MNIKELAKKIKEDISDNLSTISFLKAVYIKLGKERIFDEKYYFGNSKTLKKMYKLAQREEFCSSETEEKRNIICVSLSYQIKKLMDELGYKCIVTPAVCVGEHIFPKIVLTDGKIIKFDLQKDLENIQLHCRTQYFGTMDIDENGLYVIDDDEQLRIDQEIAYIKTVDDYNDSILGKFDKKLKGNSKIAIWDKLEILLLDQEVINMTRNAGYVETYNFYTKRLLPRYFLKGQINCIICSKITDKENSGDDNKEYTNCLYSDTIGSPEAVYLFSRIHNRYIRTTFSCLAELEKERFKYWK